MTMSSYPQVGRCTKFAADTATEFEGVKGHGVTQREPRQSLS